VPVRNVAQPVINDCYRLVHLGAGSRPAGQLVADAAAVAPPER